MKKRTYVVGISVALIGAAGGFLLDSLHIYGYAGGYSVVVAMAVIAAMQITEKAQRKR